MTHGILRLSGHAGELEFDGIHAVASMLDVGYPEIKRVTSESASLCSERTHSVKVGTGELVLEGYLLGCDALSGASPDAAGELAGLKSRLMSVCAPGQEFFLILGGRKRALYASGLTFSRESPFGSGVAEKFRLTAFSDVPFFHGGEIAFAGTARTSSGLTLPASGEFTTAVAGGTSDVFIRNDGDECCGFVMEAQFGADSMHFRITSDRESDSMHIVTSFTAGEKILISTVPGDRYVKRENGTSLIPYADESCVFHTLPPGDTCITFRSYTSVEPVVSVRFTPGYLIP